MENHQKKEPVRDIKKARELYQQGTLAWQRGDRAAAMTLYAESAELDPEGPGTQALRMSNDIMSFFDPNRLNP